MPILATSSSRFIQVGRWIQKWPNGGRWIKKHGIGGFQFTSCHPRVCPRQIEGGSSRSTASSRLNRGESRFWMGRGVGYRGDTVSPSTLEGEKVPGPPSGADFPLVWQTCLDRLVWKYLQCVNDRLAKKHLSGKALNSECPPACRPPSSPPPPHPRVRGF